MKKKLKLKKIGNTADGSVIFRVKKQTHFGSEFGEDSNWFRSGDVTLVSKDPTNITTDNGTITLCLGTITLCLGGLIICTMEQWYDIKLAVDAYNAVFSGIKVGGEYSRGKLEAIHLYSGSHMLLVIDKNGLSLRPDVEEELTRLGLPSDKKGALCLKSSN